MGIEQIVAGLHRTVVAQTNKGDLSFRQFCAVMWAWRDRRIPDLIRHRNQITWSPATIADQKRLGLPQTMLAEVIPEPMGAEQLAANADLTINVLKGEAVDSASPSVEDLVEQFYDDLRSSKRLTPKELTRLVKEVIERVPEPQEEEVTGAKV